MTPGRSLSANTMCRSIAPVASTTLPGAHLPQPLARQVVAGAGEMVGDALDQADEILRVVAEGGRARQQPDIVHRGELRDASPAPRPSRPGRRSSRRSRSAARRRTPPARREDDAHAALGRRKRRREAGRAAAQHQHVAMGEARRIVVGIGLVRRDAEAGRRADVRLVERLPGRLRPHEGLVVEAGREERRGEVVDRADVEGERRPAVLRHGASARHRAPARWRGHSASCAPRRARSSTSAFGSSAPADRMPRGR